MTERVKMYDYDMDTIGLKQRLVRNSLVSIYIYKVPQMLFEFSRRLSACILSLMRYIYQADHFLDCVSSFLDQNSLFFLQSSFYNHGKQSLCLDLNI